MYNLPLNATLTRRSALPCKFSAYLRCKTNAIFTEEYPLFAYWSCSLLVVQRCAVLIINVVGRIMARCEMGGYYVYVCVRVCQWGTTRIHHRRRHHYHQHGHCCHHHARVAGGGSSFFLSLSGALTQHRHHPLSPVVR